MEWNDMDAPIEEEEKRIARSRRLRRANADDLWSTLRAVQISLASELKRRPKLKERIDALVNKTR